MPSFDNRTIDTFFQRLCTLSKAIKIEFVLPGGSSKSTGLGMVLTGRPRRVSGMSIMLIDKWIDTTRMVSYSLLAHHLEQQVTSQGLRSTIREGSVRPAGWRLAMLMLSGTRGTVIWFVWGVGGMECSLWRKEPRGDTLNNITQRVIDSSVLTRTQRIHIMM